MSLLYTETGRLRLGLRIGLFMILTLTLTAALSLVTPPTLPFLALPLLLGSLISGWVLLWMDGRGPGALGFYLGPDAGMESGKGLVLGILVAGSVVVLMAASGALRWAEEPGTTPGYLMQAGTSLWLFALPAAAEEALMRGYLLQALAEAWGSLWSLTLTSVVFGFLHVGNPEVSWIGLGNIVAAGFFLGVVYLKTGSLWWATAAHLGWNWTHGFLADLPVSGLNLVDTPFLDPILRGPGWLSGGPFGAEGSVLAAIVLIASTIILWRSSWLGPGGRARKVRPLHLSISV